jgi:hypothetical protein
MKSFIAAVSFTVAAVPAFAAPYEQTQADRALPQIAQSASGGASRAPLERGRPFEQTQLDRSQAEVSVQARSSGAVAKPSVDFNRIAPAL